MRSDPRTPDLRTQPPTNPGEIPGWLDRWARPVMLLAVLAGYSLIFSSNVFRMQFGAQIIVYAIAALGLNVALGYGGLLSVAQGGLVGLGAYACAISMGRLGCDYVVAMVIAGAICTVAMGVVTLVAARVKTHYFLIVTIAVQQTFTVLAVNLVDLTGGAQGMVVEPASVFGYRLDTPAAVFGFGAALLLISFYALDRLRGSKTGTGLQGLRNSLAVATSSGIAPMRHYLVAGAVCGAAAGVAGALYAPLVGFISPTSFGIQMSILLLVMVVVGGLGSSGGALIGAAIILVVQDQTQSLASGLSTVLFGLILMGLLLIAPGGVGGLIAKIALAARRRWRERLRRRPSVHQTEEAVIS